MPCRYLRNAFYVWRSSGLFYLVFVSFTSWTTSPSPLKSISGTSYGVFAGITCVVCFGVSVTISWSIKLTMSIVAISSSWSSSVTILWIGIVSKRVQRYVTPHTLMYPFSPDGMVWIAWQYSLSFPMYATETVGLPSYETTI